MVLDGLRVAALLPVNAAEAVQCIGIAGPVADLAGEGEGLLVVLDGLPVVALPPVDEAEVVQRIGFPGPVADLAEQGQGMLLSLIHI